MKKKFIFDIKNIQFTSYDNRKKYDLSIYDADSRSLYAFIYYQQFYNKEINIFIDYKLTKQKIRNNNYYVLKKFYIDTILPKPDVNIKNGSLYKLNGVFSKKIAKKIKKDIAIRLICHLNYLENYDAFKKIKEWQKTSFASRLGVLSALNRMGIKKEVPLEWQYEFAMITDMIIIYNKKTKKIYRVAY